MNDIDKKPNKCLIPYAVLCELTHRCPLSCPYCSNPVQLEMKSNEISTEIWKKALTEAVKIGILQAHFSGGEPTARKDLEEIIKHASSIGLYTNLITSGVLLNPDVDAIFGLHIWSQISAGKVFVRSKGIMAAVNEFRIDIEGVQTHGSTPWTGIDPIVTASQIINSIQTIVSRNMPLTEAAAVVTIGSIHGGVRSNIIPESLYMLGTIRTLDNNMKKIVLKRLEEIVKNVAEANNAKAKVTYLVSYPITYNDPALYNQMLPTLKRINGDENVGTMNAVTGAEDFSFFQEKVPGMYYFIGGTKKGEILN